MRYGFYCRMYGKDCFIETNQIKRTKNLAIDFINKVQNKINKFYGIGDNEIDYVQKAMRPAVMELKKTNNGLYYIDINGEDFGGYGCDPCENPFEVCVIVN